MAIDSLIDNELPDTPQLTEVTVDAVLDELQLLYKALELVTQALSDLKTKVDSYHP